MANLSNNEIKRLKSFNRKKFRDESGLFIIEGEKMLQEASASDFEVLEVYRKEDIGEEAMRRISLLDSPSPVLAVVRQKPVQTLQIDPEGLYLALDGVRDPGNMGTIMRICDWFGIDGIFASKDCVEQYNPKVIQSSMGSVFRKSVVYTDLPELCAEFKSMGLPVFGTFLDGENLYRRNTVRPEGLIVMGNEAHGVSAEVGALCDRHLLIPSYARGPHAESLNVAVATAVIVSEFKRLSIYEKD